MSFQIIFATSFILFISLVEFPGVVRVRDSAGRLHPAKRPGQVHDAGPGDHGLQGRHAKNHGDNFQTQPRRPEGKNTYHSCTVNSPSLLCNYQTREAVMG